tara:strand:+ start:229 stop:1011 length:783 start_codon:yes stop_codon:yes gene_type:complete
LVTPYIFKYLLKLVFCLLLLIAVASKTKAQKSISDSSISVSHIDFMYSLQIPSADLADRFGFFHGIGGGFFYKASNNFEYGGGATFLFGNQLRERSIIDNLLTQNSTILDSDGRAANLLVSMRGWQVRGNIGKVFSFNRPNPNSGVLVRLGIGFMQHKIRVEDRQVNTPQLAWPYQKGYDRLSNGLMLTQFVGYQIYSNTKLVNFYAGIEFNEAFTKNRRAYNFSEKRQDTDARFDSSIGFKFGWMIPIYKRAPKDFYFE